MMTTVPAQDIALAAPLVDIDEPTGRYAVTDVTTRRLRARVPALDRPPGSADATAYYRTTGIDRTVLDKLKNGAKT